MICLGLDDGDDVEGPPPRWAPQSILIFAKLLTGARYISDVCPSYYHLVVPLGGTSAAA